MGIPLAPSTNAEQGGDALLIQLGANHAQTSGIVSRAAADLGYAGHIVEVQPAAAVHGRHDALGAQHHAERRITQRGQRAAKLVFGELMRRFHAPRGENLIRVVVMAATAAMVVMMMLVVMVVATTGAVRPVVVVMMFVIVLVLMLMVVMMFVFMFMLVMVVMVMLVMGLVRDFVKHLLHQITASLHRLE